MKVHPECPICGAAWIDEDDKGRCVEEHAAVLCQQCGERKQIESGMCDECIVAGMRGEL